MVSVENSKLQHPLFLGKIDREKVFGDVLDRELVFLDHKNIVIRKSHNLHFFKGLVSTSFGQKFKTSSVFLFG